MPAIINSDNGVVSGSAGLKTSGANDGILALQNNGTTNVTVTAAGNVGIGTSSPGSFDSSWNRLVVGAGSGDVGQTIYAGSASTATIAFADGTTGAQQYAGLIRYLHASDAMTYWTNGAERARIDSSGNFQFNSGYGSVATAYGCRAWVNFNGTSTVAIRASGNVTSITDNGTGDYTVNFTTAMPDANSSVNVTCQRMDVTSFEATYSGIRSNTSSNITASSARVYTAFSNTAAFDAGQVCVSVFR